MAKQTITSKSDVLDANTSVLLAFYNEHAEKPVKRFADRRSAERRCIELLEAMSSKKAKGQKAATVMASVAKAVVKKAAEPKAPGAPRKFNREAMSEGQRLSWQDPDVREARCERSAVSVDGTDYKSVAAAFDALNLPRSRLCKFRLQLKEQGKLHAFDMDWLIVPLNY